MQSDIAQRLLAWSPLVASGYQVPAASQTMDEAAAEIERLQTLVAAFNNGMPPITTKEAAAEIARLTEALRAAEEREKALREALPKAPPDKRTHTCRHHGDNCQEHNLHCGWPDCAILRPQGATPC